MLAQGDPGRFGPPGAGPDRWYGGMAAPDDRKQDMRKGPLRPIRLPERGRTARMPEPPPAGKRIG
jgi:hypothetical protein